MSIILSDLNGAKRRSIFVVVIVFLSLLAGMVGSYFAATFDLAIFGLGTVNEVTPDYDPRMNVVIREAKNVVITQNEQVQRLATAYRDNSLTIFRKTAKDQPNSEKFYLLSRPFAEAMPVTSDGWLVTNFRGRFKSEVFKASEFVVVTKGKSQYDIDRVIKDEKNGLFYLHIKTSDLSLYKVANEQAVVGSTVLAANHDGQIVSANVLRLASGPESYASADLDRAYIFDEKIDQNFSAVITLAGEFAAFINQDGRAISSQAIIGATNSILKFGAIKRPALGMYCHEVADLVPVDGKKGAAAGCLVYRGSEAAVAADGPADRAGIRTGDIVTAVDQEQLIGSLASAISLALPGDKVSLTINRAGAVRNIEIILGERK